MIKALTFACAVGAIAEAKKGSPKKRGPKCNTDDVEFKSVLYKVMSNMTEHNRWDDWFVGFENYYDNRDRIRNKRIEFLPNCGNGDDAVATMMHVTLVGGDFVNKNFDNATWNDDEHIDKIAFNGVDMDVSECKSDFHLPSDDDFFGIFDDEYYGNAFDCNIMNKICGDFDITNLIRSGEDGVNVFSASATDYVGGKCGSSNFIDNDGPYQDLPRGGGLQWMMLVTFHCADVPVRFFDENAALAASAGSSVSVSNTVTSVLAYVAVFVFGSVITAFAMNRRNNKAGFEAVAEDSVSKI